MPYIRAPRFPVLLLAACSAACGRAEQSVEGPTRIEVWAHAGQQAERAVLEAQVARFNAEQDSVEVALELLPEGSYHAQIQAAAVAGRLPDLIDVDGPYVPSLAWQGRLRPAGPLFSDSLVADLLPSIVAQGTWRGALWAVGTFDSGLGLYVSRSALREAGARLPTAAEEAWTAEELETILATLARADPDGAVLDLKLNYDGEWFTYAFQPAIRSGGGRLLELLEGTPGDGPPLDGTPRDGTPRDLREGTRLDLLEGAPRAHGAIDGSRTIAALETLQSWITGGLVDANLDDRAFADGRVAISWSGHWDYPGYAEALGDDLAVVPLPDFGEGARTGQGSWMWAVPARSRHPEAAAALVSFLLRPEEVLAMVEANGAVPGTRTAAERSRAYGPGGPLALLRSQLEEGHAVARPLTPAYPFVSSVFQDVFEAVRNGESLAPVLADAARTIDREIRDNEGYPPT